MQAILVAHRAMGKVQKERSGVGEHTRGEVAEHTPLKNR
jgi:hypothetical protein